MKTKLIGLILLTFSMQSFSQEISAPVKKVSHRIGLHAGTTSGLGLSYKAVIKDKFEIQLTTLPFASQSNKMIFSGLNLGYKFMNNRVLDMLVILSVSDYYQYTISDGSYYYDYTSNSYLTEGNIETYTNNLNSSIGLGFELGNSEAFKFNFQVGYALYNMLSKDWQTLPSVGIGFDFLLSRSKK